MTCFEGGVEAVVGGEDERNAEMVRIEDEIVIENVYFVLLRES